MFVNLAQFTCKALLVYSMVLHTLSQWTFRAVLLGGQDSIFKLEISKHTKEIKERYKQPEPPLPLSPACTQASGGEAAQALVYPAWRLSPPVH